LSFLDVQFVLSISDSARLSCVPEIATVISLKHLILQLEKAYRGTDTGIADIDFKCHYDIARFSLN
jgi:hypothetical protein